MVEERNRWWRREIDGGGEKAGYNFAISVPLLNAFPFNICLWEGKQFDNKIMHVITFDQIWCYALSILIPF